MAHETIVILGIPIDNLDLTETVEQTLSLVEAYGRDGRARQVATVNVDFVVNTLTWRLSRPRHPELLDILRKADLVTPDGMPMVWASRLLGTPLKERVTGADLVPRLAQAAAARGKSIYFLGGRGDVGQRAARKLKNQIPNLKIAGIDSPFVRIEGETLDTALDEDRAIVDRINRSGADILLIGFGNPKQEVWFERNRHRLQVPVSIGVGGTYEFIVGSVARAPEWMQKYGLEWLFRITQDPARLWKRYFVGFFKFGVMIFPSIVYYRFKKLVFQTIHRKAVEVDVQKTDAVDAAAQPLKVVALPRALDAAAVEQLQPAIETDLSRADHCILDFSGVKFVDSSGLGLLLSLWRRAGTRKKKICMIAMSATVRRFFELNRTFDLFAGQIFDNLDGALTRIQKQASLPSFYYVQRIRNQTVTLNLAGILDAGQMAGLDIAAVETVVGNRNCILNLKDLSFVDSSGIVFFLKIQKYTSGRGRTSLLCAVQDNVLQMFRITKLNRLFTIVSDQAAAEKAIGSIGEH
jgi:N-acetylglucosaminyldiphosphoundecaprenol N-acetyl-beta-D-mannosaminyltransferase